MFVIACDRNFFIITDGSEKCNCEGGFLTSEFVYF